MSAPLPFIWNGEAMEIDPRFRKQADKDFVIGERYRMTVQEERSAASHNHYFAILDTLWDTLPEHETERFPTVEHLRKYALIRAGYRDERSIVCASKAEAQRMAAFIKPIDEYAIVATSEAVVRVWTAQSQSKKAMGAKRFQESKDAVIGEVARMIDAEPSALSRAENPPPTRSKTPAKAGA